MIRSLLFLALWWPVAAGCSGAPSPIADGGLGTEADAGLPDAGAEECDYTAFPGGVPCLPYLQAVSGPEPEAIRRKYSDGCADASDCVVIRLDFFCEGAGNVCPRAVLSEHEGTFRMELEQWHENACSELVGCPDSCPTILDFCGSGIESLQCVDGQCEFLP